MTDEQVLRYVMKEHEAGTSQSQIITKLMQRGVDIQQIRRVKKTYERVAKDKGLGQVSAGTTKEKANDRMRKNNGAEKEDHNSDFKIKATDKVSEKTVYDKTNPDFRQMQSELSDILPDSIIIRDERLEAELNKKKVFGRDIFNRKDLSFEPNMNIATPQNYRIGPGDAVIIDVYGASQKSEQLTVSPDGDITIEGFGPVQVSGLTVAQANARLRSTLGSRYSSSRVRLTVGQTRTIMVNVMGEVKAPGTYTLSAFASVFHALYMAGGINDLGTLRNIKVYRNNKLVTMVDIYDYILNGKLTGNIRLADNDVIVVGAYDCLVNITGKVKRPMYYEMKKNESVGTLIKYAGGFTGDAYKKSVRLIRKTGREFSVFSVDEFDMNTFHLADADSVSVDSILQRYSNMVEVKGAVFRPGMYQVGGNINSVRTLLEYAEGFTEEAFTAHAVMHRMRPDRTLEVIPVDVEGIMNGKVADIPLQKNDVLFIPTKAEMMQQQTITIHGEVVYPGIYKYAANETLEDLVLQAGGLKESASTVKVDVARRIINSKALTTDSVISRTYTFALKDGFVIDGQPGFTLQPFDEVYVRKSPGYNEQKNIEVRGQVMFAGTYTLVSKNERLTDAIKKAGGITDMAYVKGARLERRITPDERLRMETVLKLAKMQSGKKDSVDINSLDLGDTYYVGIELDKALEKPGGDADLVLREGDRIIVPEYNGTVKISGNVMYPNTVAYEKGKRPSWYIDQAGGFGNRAKKGSTYIIYMNGTVARVGHNAKIRPGCEIVVPTKPESNGKGLAQWLSIGTSVAGIATMIATIANLIK
ncbi:polysaccharide biosynthesis/export protein [Hoylesella saccharolytica F0055]|uniref:Polysaccharide biosynthesis/export protein n=2 Tax=Hoylesella TaxID=2974257 RepID=L1N816_9BACT|nr:polysaccharide biosynthesis/export protein [Hoylesella saccharolytica F0055]